MISWSRGILPDFEFGNKSSFFDPRSTEATEIFSCQPRLLVLVNAVQEDPWSRDMIQLQTKCLIGAIHREAPPGHGLESLQ